MTDSTRIVLFLSLVLVLLLTPLTALGDPTGEINVPQERASMSHDEALRTDAETIAEQEGWDEDDALARLERQQEFGELIGEFLADYPDTYGGAWTETETVEGSMHVRFVDEVPQAARDAASRRNLSVEFHDDAINSRLEREERIVRLHEELLRRGYESVSVGSSVSRQRILATVTRQNNDRSDEERRSELSDEARKPDVRITFTDQPVAGAAHAYGGGTLLNGYYLDLLCTTGFAHQTGSGATGVMTAGHCNDLNQTITDYEQEDGLRFSVDEGGEHEGSYGDFMGYHTSHYDLPEFYSDYGIRRDTEDVVSWRSISEGDIWCRFGRRTGYDCDFVYDPSIRYSWTKPNGESVTYDRMVAMETFSVDYGDSGGPWFISTTAAGITSGWETREGVRRDTWSKVDYISYIWSEHDLEVMTQ